MFENTKAFYLFLLLPVLVGLFIFFNLHFKKSAKKLAGDNVDTILPYYTEGQKWISLLLYTIGFCLLITSLARPRWGIENISTDLKGRDVLIMIDVSYSMAVPDVVPNRIELAKKYINELLESGIEDRIGLMVFSSESELLVPITHDYAAVSFFVESIYPGMIGKGGTDIGNALIAGIKSFDDTDFSNKMIVLITDGEDLEGKVKNNKAFIKDSNIRIFTVGIGTKNGEPIPLRNNKGEIESYVKAPNGTHVVSKLDEALLSEIAEMTGGSYMRTGGKSGELVTFINQIKNVKSKDYDKTDFTQKKDQYVIFLGVALLLFCLGFILDLGRFVKRSKTNWMMHIFAVALLFLPSFMYGQTPQAQTLQLQKKSIPDNSVSGADDDASDDSAPVRKSKNHAGRNKNGAWKGNRSFDKGDFSKALSAYGSAVYAFSGNQLAKLYLNLGNTFVKTQNPENAGKYYEMALNTASDDELKSRILYQTGLLMFKNRQYSESAALFKESLKLNDNNDDARYNYAVAELFAENEQNDNESQDEQEQQDDESSRENKENAQEQEQQKQEEKKAANMKEMLESLENMEKENSRRNSEEQQKQQQQQQLRGKYW